MKCRWTAEGKCTNTGLKYKPEKCDGRFSSETKYCHVPDIKWRDRGD